MDAFAVSVCKGLAMPKINKNLTLIIALFFGGFQALMPLLGWFLGGAFYNYIHRYGSIISFLLLFIIGGKMVLDSIKEWKNPEEVDMSEPKIDLKEFFLLAIATSIDAFAVGVTFSLMSVAIIPAITVIGLTTFCLTIVAVFIGHLIGSRLGTPAQLIGGLVLIFLGCRILILSIL